MQILERFNRRFQTFCNKWAEEALVLGGVYFGLLWGTSHGEYWRWFLFIPLVALLSAAYLIGWERLNLRRLVDQAAAPRDNTGNGQFSMLVWVAETREFLGWRPDFEASDQEAKTTRLN